ncbi:hypothetical protein GF314_01220 [bacterium]|nr:hypothetical protein [bacterium]
MTDRDPILDAARDLPRRVEPSRDLWPEIRRRMDAPPLEVVGPRDRGATVWNDRWRHLASGVALAAALVAGVLLVRPGTMPAPDETATPGAATVATLDRAYDEARTELATVLAARCDEWPATACAPLIESARNLDRSAESLRTALASVPADSPTRPLLVARFEDTVARTRDLTSRLVRL